MSKPLIYLASASPRRRALLSQIGIPHAVRPVAIDEAMDPVEPPDRYVLRLAERTILVRAGEAAEFSTMVPHAFGATGGPAEILCILDHEGERSHLGPHQ